MQPLYNQCSNKPDEYVWSLQRNDLNHLDYHNEMNATYQQRFNKKKLRCYDMLQKS